MNAIVQHNGQAATRFAPDQIDLIKQTICKGATDNELKLFLYQAEKAGLDPLARQIYSIERRENRGGQWVTVRSIQTSIDGFRLVAERSGKYAGQVGPFWCDDSGNWQDVWLLSSPPVAARVGVLRHDFKEPCWGVARFDAYAQKKDGKPTRMWAQMADVMLAKCAEALALRKAFPQELSGLYTSDEMDQAQTVEPTPAAPTLIPTASVSTPVTTSTIQSAGVPRALPVPETSGKRQWVVWGASLIGAFKAAATFNELTDWWNENQVSLSECQEAAPKAYRSIDGAYEKRSAELEPVTLESGPTMIAHDDDLELPESLRRT